MAIMTLHTWTSLRQSRAFATSISVKESPSMSQCPSYISMWYPTMRVSPEVRIHRRGILWRAKVGEERADSTQESASGVASGESQSGVTPPLTLTGAKGFGTRPTVASTEKRKSSTSTSSSGSRRRAPPWKPLIGVQAADQQTLQIETAVVASLAFLFAIILLEGILLAGSGLLPDEWDQFAVNTIYPGFTPSVGVFLAVAASYLLWKYLSGGPGSSNK